MLYSSINAYRYSVHYQNQAQFAYILRNNVSFAYYGAEFEEPLRIESVNGVIQATINIENYQVTNELFSYTGRAFCYFDRCSVPGPTLLLSPGDRLK